MRVRNLTDSKLMEGKYEKTREYPKGIPFVSKIMSGGLSEWQKKNVPLSIAREYEEAVDKKKKTERQLENGKYK